MQGAQFLLRHLAALEPVAQVPHHAGAFRFVVEEAAGVEFRDQPAEEAFQLALGGHARLVRHQLARRRGLSLAALVTEVDTARPDAALLVAAGEVDTLTAPRLEAAVDELLGSGAEVLVADLTGVTFLASSGLAVLIRGAHLASAQGRRLRLVAEGRPVLRPLQITGTEELFDLHGDRAAALAVDRD